MLNDSDQALLARKVLEENKVEIPIEALSEVVYVLNGYYEVPRERVSDWLIEVLTSTNCSTSNLEAVLEGLRTFRVTKLDFVDCMLFGYRKVYGDTIHTFDRQLQTILDRM